jgi:thioredoxin-dependent peroxiredoxin
MIRVGEKAPGFCLPDKDEKEVCLKDFRGKWVVLYFYPRDNTKGCTIEAADFTTTKEEFKSQNAEILGVSADSAASHLDFVRKHSLTITLLSDTERRIVNDWGVWGKKKLYGKEYEGIIRSTFLIDPEGTVREVWDKVSVQNHVKDVLERLKALR